MRLVGRAVIGLGLAGLLAGCGPFLTANVAPPAHEMGPWMGAAPARKLAALAREEFSLELVRFTDARRPRTLERPPSEQLLDGYDPDDLLAGVTTRLPALYQKYLTFKPRQRVHYLMELELKELRTEVLTGTLLSGAFGRYAVVMEIEALVRQPNSEVVLKRAYTFERALRRKTYNGRSPSVAMDEARLTDLVDAAVRETALLLNRDMTKIAWEEQDALDLADPVPTTQRQLLPQPTLMRATGSQTGFGSELVLPEPAPEGLPPAYPPVPFDAPPEPIPHAVPFLPRG